MLKNLGSHQVQVEVVKTLALSVKLARTMINVHIYYIFGILLVHVHYYLA